MTLSLILILVSLTILLVLFRAVRGQSALVRQVDDLAGNLQPVDLEAFRNLTDPEEQEFLRLNLTPRDFRFVQRQRLRAAAAYVACAARNASILLRLGEATRLNPNPQVVEAGQQLIDTALRLRIFAFLALARLYLGILLPASRLSPADIADRYQQLSGLLTQLGRLQYPGRGARISATI